MEIDPRQQQATVAAQRATERQKKALLDYNTIELDRQKKLFAAGITSRDAMDQAQQAFDNSKADYEAAVAARKTCRNNNSPITPYARLSTASSAISRFTWGITFLRPPCLTTVDQTRDLEAYIYMPTERAGAGAAWA